MRSLGALLAVWGVCCLGALANMSGGVSAMPWWIPALSLLYVGVGAVLVAVTPTMRALVPRLIGLWAVACLLVALVTAPTGTGLPLVVFALVYGTLGFLMWTVLPVVTIWGMNLAKGLPSTRELRERRRRGN